MTLAGLRGLTVPLSSSSRHRGRIVQQERVYVCRKPNEVATFLGCGFVSYLVAMRERVNSPCTYQRELPPSACSRVETPQPMEHPA